MVSRELANGGVRQGGHSSVRRPRSVRLAVWMMLIGVAVTVAEMVVLIRSAADLLDRFLRALQPPVVPLIRFDGSATVERYYGPWVTSFDTLVNVVVAGIVALALMVVVCCLWMAWMTHQGHHWARILTTVLGVVFVIGWIPLLTIAWTLNLIDPTVPAATMAALPLLVAIPTLILLWTPESSEFIDRQKG